MNGRQLQAPRRDAVALALETMRSMIVRGKLAPGAELSQVQLARDLGVSTTPLREALRQLEAEGLIESRHNRRPRVPPFDVDDLETVYVGRVLLESLAVSLSVPLLTDTHLEELRHFAETMRRAGDAQDITPWHAAHDSFHAGLVAGCSAPLRQQIAVLATRSDRYRLMSVLSEQPAGWVIGNADHMAIVAACEAGDAALASVRLAENLTHSALTLVAQLAPDVDPKGIRLAFQMVASLADQQSHK